MSTSSGRRRRRAASPGGERVKAVATAALATGALVGAVSQVAPALAHGAPLLPESDAPDESVAPSEAEEAAEVALAAAQQFAAPVAEEPAPAPVAEATPVAAPVAQPFGMQNLPPELAGPLGQVEDFVQGLQHQIAPQQGARPVAGAISSGYGHRWGSFHYGLDFADALGAPIHSVASGTVIEAGPAAGFGLWVRVLHDDGHTAVYGHVNEIFVQEGQRVNTGDVIASVGNRGQSTGPHLHLEVWDGGQNKIDPLPYLAAKGVPMEWGPSSH